MGDEADAGELQGGAVGMNSANTTDDHMSMNTMHTHEWYLAAMGRYGELYLCWCRAERVIVTSGSSTQERLQWITIPPATTS
jgi:hypothetical protein